MKTEMIVKSGLTAVAFLLISTAAVAQSAPARRPAHPTKPAHQSSDIKPREGNSGMATGRYQRKSGAIIASDSRKNSVHAAQSLNQSKKGRNGDNPLYENSGHSGTNPLYESNRINDRPGRSVQQPPRQSNKVAGAPLKGVGTAARSKRHPAAVKYQNREAAGAGSGSSHARER